MRFQVPQFVDIEDKVVGPFTLKQFLIYVFTAMALAPAYLAFDLSLFVIVALPAIGIAAAFAHVRFHGKSLFSVVSNALGFFSRGQLYVWQRTASLRPLKITGEEYGDFTDFATGSAVPVRQGQISSLSAKATELETAGHIGTDDTPDPLAGEEEAVEKQ